MPNTPANILIIDNDEGLLAAISTRLESMGYRCITAVSGAQGLACFREQPIDLIISDLNMPAGDGVTLAQTIRETSEIPIIIITGFRDEYRRSLRSITNITLMEKPFDSDHLLDLVEAELVMAGSKLPV
jgi:DNA-binding response OmpR family regulator